MEKKTVYIANDSKLFYTEKECISHENANALIEEFKYYLPEDYRERYDAEKFMEDSYSAFKSMFENNIIQLVTKGGCHE